MQSQLVNLIIQIFVAAFAATGLMEYLKNFLKTKTMFYAIIMPLFSIGCFLVIYFLPLPIIGSILTIGTVQINYQVIVQGFTKILQSLQNKIGGTNG